MNPGPYAYDPQWAISSYPQYLVGLNDINVGERLEKSKKCLLGTE